MKSKFILFPLLALLLAALACNFPSAANNLSRDSIRQTMEAPGNPNPTSTAPPVYPAPGSPTPEAGTPIPVPAGTVAYTTRSGDTLTAISLRFGVPAEQITSAQAIASEGFLPPGITLLIPDVLGEVTPEALLLPDSEAIDSPSSIGFDLAAFVQKAGGFLSSYHETVEGATASGSEIIQRVSSEASVNPRLLLALLEYRAGWVYGQPRPGSSQAYPLGFGVPDHRGLYEEMMMAATHLEIGYYGQRWGTLTNIRFSDGKTARLNPRLNPGTAGLQNLMAKFYKPGDWHEVLYGQENFLGLYQEMFGNLQAEAAQTGPLFPPGISQPDMELPFLPGERWSFSGGPHPSWNTGTPSGALDFSPVDGQATCAVSKAWATAAAPGLITRAAHNVVALDLDGDGSEQTGWVLVYMHLADQDLIQAGVHVRQDQPLGHPSCERGRSTGKHVHIARKYNGEWLPAGGPLPFVLSGWQVQVGSANYKGELVKGDQVVPASFLGIKSSVIVR